MVHWLLKSSKFNDGNRQPLAKTLLSSRAVTMGTSTPSRATDDETIEKIIHPMVHTCFVKCSSVKKGKTPPTKLGSEVL